MTPQRWRQIEELYQAAQDLSVADRNTLLESADPELRATVASMLAQDEGAAKGTAQADSGNFLERPAWEGRGSLLNDNQFRTQTLVRTGQRLGPYQIDQKIGEGGMGEVFRATDTRLNRTVAIKVSLTQFNERFLREARVIAALNHPHIAALFDVGSFPSGMGYLVLEYVEALLWPT